MFTEKNLAFKGFKRNIFAFCNLVNWISVNDEAQIDFKFGIQKL